MAERKPLFQSAAGWYEEMATSDTATFGGLTLGGNIVMGTNKITGLGNPSDPQDAATKAYVDGVATGLDFKQSVRVKTVGDYSTWTPAGSGVGATLTSPDNLTANNDFDSVTVALGNRVLMNGHGGDEVTPDAENGIYTVTQLANGSVPTILTRATDFDSSAEVTGGAFTFVTEGTLHADTGWVLSTDDAIVLETTNLLFTQFSATTALTYDQGLAKTGNSITVELDTAANAQGAGAGGGSSGLEFDANNAAGKLRAAVHATAGLERTASGLGVKLNGTTLQSAAGGVSVKGLPALFEIATVAVGANVTAPNLDTLTGGAGADALHYHAASKISVNVDEAVAVADPLVAGTTNDRVQKALANTDAKSYVLGIAETAQGSVGSATRMVMRGPAAGVLTGATIGDRYYLAAAGGLTAANTPPGAGNRVILMGVAKNATDLWVNILDYGKKAA